MASLETKGVPESNESNKSVVSLTAAAVPKGFGSFHSASVEVLVRQTDAEYRIPHVPVKLTDVAGSLRSCGHAVTIPAATNTS